MHYLFINHSCITFGRDIKELRRNHTWFPCDKWCHTS